MKFALRIFVALIAFGASTYVSAQGRTETSHIECNSEDFESKFCAVPGLLEGRLIKQLSDTSCYFRHNITSEGINVWGGCRAIFRVVQRKRAANRDLVDVVCESQDKKYKFCPVSNLRNAYLSENISSTRCRENINYWITSDGIAVDDGCRAVFTVEKRGRRGGFGRHGGRGGRGGIF